MRVFFPPAAAGEGALVQGFAVFAIGYLMRPVGSLVLGPVGDRLGRRWLLMVRVLGIAIACTLIGLLPTHQQWGASAGRLLIALHMFQGLALGGEYNGSITSVVEAAPPGRCGSIGSLPFLLAGLLAAVALWLRRALPEVRPVRWARADPASPCGVSDGQATA